MVFIGSIPEELGNLSQLTELYLNYNQFNSYPANLFIKMQLLKNVYIAINIDIIVFGMSPYKEMFKYLPTTCVLYMVGGKIDCKDTGFTGTCVDW